MQRDTNNYEYKRKMKLWMDRVELLVVGIVPVMFCIICPPGFNIETKAINHNKDYNY